MPMYEFFNEETGDHWEEMMSYDAMKTFMAENPVVRQIYALNMAHAPGSDGGGKVPDNFKEVMSKIAENNPNTPLADQYGSKSVKEVKTRSAVEKAKKRAGGSFLN